jgi:hypothetical protein
VSRRIFLAALLLLSLLGTAWLLFGGGIETIADVFGLDWERGARSRRALLLACTGIYTARLGIRLARRSLGWRESAWIAMSAGVVPIALALAVLGGMEPQRIGWPDLPAILLAAVGATLHRTRLGDLLFISGFVLLGWSPWTR